MKQGNPGSDVFAGMHCLHHCLVADLVIGSPIFWDEYALGQCFLKLKWNR